MQEELRALEKKKTWEKTWEKAVECRWVFTSKQTPKGKIDRYKARLVAKDIVRHMVLITLRLSHL